MQESLFIEWNTEDDLFDHPILDEQHRALIAIINSMHYFIEQGWTISDLKPSISILEDYISFHLKTEELILSKNGLSGDKLSIVRDYRDVFQAELSFIVKDSIVHKDPNELPKYLLKWWQGHKSEFHNKLEEYIKP